MNEAAFQTTPRMGRRPGAVRSWVLADLLGSGDSRRSFFYAQSETNEKPNVWQIGEDIDLVNRHGVVLVAIYLGDLHD